jgi:SAM-dependent methyltransferase
MDNCPVCGSEQLVADIHFSVDMVAQHFVPRRLDTRRHERLRRKLESLWAGDEAVLHRCTDCMFGFPVPYVAGDAEFYNLASGGSQNYPTWRWEFGLTLVELPRANVILECGAGTGEFLRRVSGYRRIALEYDEGALSKLRALGIEAFAQDITEFEAHADVVCLFQTLEHLAPIDNVFSALRQVLSARGDLFVSVPNGAAIDVQERITGLMDMPPNHVGRWYPETIEAACRKFGFDLVRLEVDRPRRLGTAWVYAQYRSRSRALRADGFDAVIGGLHFRPLRGLLRRGRALLDVPRLALATTPGLDMWAHLRAR